MHDLLFRRNFQNLINVLNLIGLTALDGYKSKMTLTKTGSANFAEPVLFCGYVAFGSVSRAPPPTDMPFVILNEVKNLRGSENGR